MSTILPPSLIQQADALLLQLTNLKTSIMSNITECNHEDFTTLKSLHERTEVLAQQILLDSDQNSKFQAKILSCRNTVQLIQFRHMSAAHSDRLHSDRIYIFTHLDCQEQPSTSLMSLIGFALDMIYNISSTFFNSRNNRTSSSTDSFLDSKSRKGS